MRPAPHGDDGVILVFAMIFLGVIAVVVTSVVGFSTTGVRNVSTSRADLAKRYAADAALKYAVQQVRVESESCNTTPNPLTPPSDFLTSNGGPFATNTDVPDVTVTCSVSGQYMSYGAAGYAVVVTDTSDLGARVSGANSGETLAVEGPVFVAAQPSSGALDLPFGISLGNAYGLSVNGVCPPRWDELTTRSPYGYGCLSDLPDPDITLPTALPPTRGSAPAKVVGDCALFLPGKYTAIDTAAYTNVYFASGVYYFEDVDIEIGNGRTLFGGRKVAGQASYSTGTQCLSDADVPAPATVDGTGVKIILGGSSRLWSDAGKVELYSRLASASGQAAEGTQGVTLMTVTPDAVAAAPSVGWKRSCQTTPVSGVCSSDDSAFVIGAGATNAGESCDGNVGGGQQTSFVVHGLLYAPDACVRLRSQSTEVQLLGGVVAGRLHIGASANIAGFSIRVPANTGPRTMRIVASAVMNNSGTDRVITATADLTVNHRTGEVAISRWVTPL